MNPHDGHTVTETDRTEDGTTVWYWCLDCEREYAVEAHGAADTIIHVGEDRS